MRVQTRKIFCFISKIQFFMNFLMKLVKFFNFFSSRFFNIKNFEWTIKNYWIAKKRPSTKVSRKDQIDTSKRGEMATVLIRWGPVDPLWPSRFFLEVWPQRVNTSIQYTLFSCYSQQLFFVACRKNYTAYSFLLFFFIYPMKYFIQTVYHIKDTYLTSTLWNFY